MIFDQCINLLTRLRHVELNADIMVKPDGVQRRVVGEICKRFEQKGFLLRGLKLVQPTQQILEGKFMPLF